MNPVLSELTGRYPQLAPCAGDIDRAFGILVACYRGDGKILLCGNGGSAADAEHWAAELLKSFRRDRRIPDNRRGNLPDGLAEHLQDALPAIPLGGFTSYGTAWLNDHDPEYLYAQLVWTLGAERDALIAISTSGNSPNILRAVEAAAAKGMATVGLSGGTGGKLAAVTDVCIRVPETEVHRIQELHLPVYHALCIMLEEEFFGGSGRR